MRKQTKVVAVASAAALLAIGASMTSFAATGWVEEDGTWYFYDNDGNRVEDTWKKSGDNWYWLDSEEGGAMAMDKLVEDDDDTYYVDSNGVMVRNSWVKIVNEEQDEDEDPAEYHYYYFQSNGKAYKAPDSSTGTTRFRTIDAKRYAFDEDGKMLYGWVDANGERQTDDDGWENATYYLGNWDEGWMKTGWQKISVYDNNEEDDMEYWFHFKSNGKKRASTTANVIKEDKINGKKYGFDDRGVMTYEWTFATDYTSSRATKASTSNWRYFNNIEDGARVTKGWFKVIAPADDNDNTFRSNYGFSFAADDADDETERWYYADGDGKVVSGQIKKIKGKYYGFRPEDSRVDKRKAGAMLNGLVLMVVDPSDGIIVDVIDDNVESDELDDLMDGTGTITANCATAETAYPGYNVSLYYFGNDEDNDGSMKSGATTVTLDGNTYNFMFNKTGGAGTRGYGLTGVDDNKYIYKYGCRIKASSDDKYQVVKVTAGTNDLHAPSVTVDKVPAKTLRASSYSFDNDDKETVSYVDVSNLATTDGKYYYLVNTSGNIQKSKVAAKDGDDWFFYVKDRAVKLYTNNKNLDVLEGKTVTASGYTSGKGSSEKWDQRKSGSTGAGVFVSDLDTGY